MTRMKLLLSLLIVSATTLSAQQTFPTPKPFGFEAGMTREQVLKLVGKAAIADDSNPEGPIFNTAPSPHPDFGMYSVVISPTHGIVKVIAIGNTIKTNDEGDELQAKFQEIESGLMAKYGPPTVTIDSVQGGDANKEPQYWMLMLSQGERTLEAIWNPKTGGGSETGITLTAKAGGLNEGYIGLVYFFPGFNDYVYYKRAQHNAVY